MSKKNVKAIKAGIKEKLKENKCACCKGGMGGAYFTNSPEKVSIKLVFSDSL